MDEIKSYDSFAKLNIMSEAKPSNNVPQIMLDLANNGSKRTWKGDRLQISYTSGYSAGSFRITEVTGSWREKLNCELMGSNNIYQGTVYNTSNNSFIFSRNNTLTNNAADNNFINADNNYVQPTGASALNFFDSDFNYILSANLSGNNASASNISLYHSNNNKFLPNFTYIKGVKGEKGIKGDVKGLKGIKGDTYIGGMLRYKTLINSHFNRLSGHNLDTAHSTLINSNNGYYKQDDVSKNIISIGNDWGIFRNVSANTIAIGNGLINYDNASDKIILGQYNTNSTDSNEVLIVGDGRVNETYLDSLKLNNPNWQSDDNDYFNILSSLSGNGSPSANSGLYRHNIFTVNKNGYVTISNWNNPSNSARYGYDGLTAYIDGVTYPIPYRDVYNKINIGDAVTQMQETVDSYTKQMNDIIETMPSNYFYSVAGTYEKVYLYEPDNPAIDSTVKYLWGDISADMNNNTILSLSYNGDGSKKLTAFWNSNSSAEISSYCAKQFMYVKNTTMTGFVFIND